MAKKKKLIVIPLAGLGNRMRTLSSCVQIAKRDNRKLWIIWPVNQDVGCDISDIFQSVGVDYSVPPKWIGYLLSHAYRLTPIDKCFWLYKLISKLFSDYSIFDRDIYDAKNELEINSDYSTILVASCLAFNTQDYRLFKFTDYLKNEVEQEYGKIGQPYIGIHIRRTDHINTIKHSPDKNYFAQIDKHLKANPAQRFFLATDDLATKENFRRIYGDRIYSLDKKLGRTDQDGIYAGVTELIMLSRSTEIICSAISSYSTAAILLGGIKNIIFVDTFLEKESVLENGMFPEKLRNL